MRKFEETFVNIIVSEINDKGYSKVIFPLKVLERINKYYPNKFKVITDDYTNLDLIVKI